MNFRKDLKKINENAKGDIYKKKCIECIRIKESYNREKLHQ